MRGSHGTLFVPWVLYGIAEQAHGIETIPWLRHPPARIEVAVPQHWLFLSDPETYHLDTLFRREKDVWDGVYGSNAQRHLAQIKKGDRILGYHTAPEKAVYAVLEAVSDCYPDPKAKEKTVWVVDVTGVRKLARAVPLAELRADKKLAKMKFLSIPRMAVSPLTLAEFEEILRLGEKG
jgi:predicted RNA-binding protein with PUA-like domain